MMNPIEYLEIRLNILSSVVVQTAWAVQELAVAQGQAGVATKLDSTLVQAEEAVKELLKRAAPPEAPSEASKLILVPK